LEVEDFGIICARMTYMKSGTWLTKNSWYLRAISGVVTCTGEDLESSVHPTCFF